MTGMSTEAMQHELLDIKCELDRLENRDAPKNELNPIRERIAAIERHLVRHNNI